MTLNLAALYLCAAAAIAMLALFARHNRKTGWVKQRKTFVSDLLDLQAAWDEIDRSVAGSSNAHIEPLTAETKAGFSIQLAHMQKALNHPTVHPETAPAKAAKAEKVLV